MIVLALDSTGPALSAAVLDGDEPLAERLWPAPRPPHAAPPGGALAALESVLADARLALDAVGLLAVATGPGSFNGIRAGIATAEGLALALNVPAVGVPTLDALSYHHAGRVPLVLALRPAGRGEYYAARYAGSWDDWQRQGDYAIGPAAEVLSDLPPGTLVCAPTSADLTTPVAERGLELAPPLTATPRAAVVGTLALRRLRAPQFDASASLRPVYLRRPGITRPTRQPGLGAAPPGSGHG